MKISTRRLRRSTLWMFLLVMPLGIRIDGNTNSELTLEGQAGTGQVYSILRDCSGDQIASEKNTYTDYAGAIQYSFQSGEGNFIVLGLRGGHLSSDYKRASGGNWNVSPIKYEYTYWNPHIAIESPYVGMGVGYLSGAPNMDFGSYQESTPISAHLRLGNYAKTHFLASFNENLPLASGGGYMNLGIGYTGGARANLFTGFALAPYDGFGVVQKVSLRLSDGFDLDLNGRAGVTEGNFEGGFSLGLRYHVPLGPESGGNRFLEGSDEGQPVKKRKGNQEIGS